MLERERIVSTYSLTRRRLVVISLYFTSLIVEPVLAWAAIGSRGKAPLASLFGGTITGFLSAVALAIVLFLCGVHYQYLLVLTRKITKIPYNRLSNEDRRIRDKAYVYAHRIHTVVVVLLVLFILMNLSVQLFPDFVLDDIKRIGVIIPIIGATLFWSLPVVIIAWMRDEALPHL